MCNDIAALCKLQITSHYHTTFIQLSCKAVNRLPHMIQFSLLLMCCYELCLLLTHLQLQSAKTRCETYMICNETQIIHVIVVTSA